jgi:hypothetical protein
MKCLLECQFVGFNDTNIIKSRENGGWNFRKITNFVYDFNIPSNINPKFALVHIQISHIQSSGLNEKPMPSPFLNQFWCSNQFILSHTQKTYTLSDVTFMVNFGVSALFKDIFWRIWCLITHLRGPTSSFGLQNLAGYQNHISLSAE